MLIRHDNAETRLTELGYQIGLVKEKQYAIYQRQQKQMKDLELHLKSISVRPNPFINAFLTSLNHGTLQGGITAYELLRRPQIYFQDLIPFFPTLRDWVIDETLLNQLEINIKFVGYLEKEIKQAQAFSKYEDLSIPHAIDYFNLAGMAMEARQKLDKVRPLTIGQASRIAGVNPSDISLLVMQIRRGTFHGNRPA